MTLSFVPALLTLCCVSGILVRPTQLHAQAPTQATTATALNGMDAEGKRHGLWQGKYPDSQRKKYEGKFEHGKEVGLFSYFTNDEANSLMATRDFKADEDVCFTIFYNPEKNKVSEGWVKNRKFDGTWTYYHYNSPQIMTVENYKNGVLDGPRKVFYRSGQLAEEENYVAGQRQGTYVKYAENGTAMESSTYEQGLYEGEAIFRNPNGQIVGKGRFVKGKKVGLWEVWDNGKMTQVNMSKKPKKFAKRVEIDATKAKKGTKN